MDNKTLKEILQKVQEGTYSIEEAEKLFKTMPFKDIDYAKVDTHRAIRQGYSEAVYCPGKTPEQIASIMLELKKHNQIVLATRADADMAQKVIEINTNIHYDREAKILTLGEYPEASGNNYVLVITAGTSDIPVAKEALITIKSNGIPTKAVYDCGIAGAQRILQQIEIIQKATAIVVVAGMEGALASFVGGISPCPVIAVPTSTGYGANFQGLAPLLSMLNSCTSCVSVVNIDNGYSAGVITSLIVRQSKDLL
jgi:NCAIR mutase (PurE)-related protein